MHAVVKFLQPGTCSGVEIDPPTNRRDEAWRLVALAAELLMPPDPLWLVCGHANDELGTGINFPTNDHGVSVHCSILRSPYSSSNLTIESHITLQLSNLPFLLNVI